MVNLFLCILCSLHVKNAHRGDQSETLILYFFKVPAVISVKSGNENDTT
jgi:hypothetical protein